MRPVSQSVSQSASIAPRRSLLLVAVPGQNNMQTRTRAARRIERGESESDDAGTQKLVANAWLGALKGPGGDGTLRSWSDAGSEITVEIKAPAAGITDFTVIQQSSLAGAAAAWLARK